MVKLRKLTMLLCVPMVFGLLTGCGPTADATKDSTKNTEVSSEDTTEISEQTQNSEQQDSQTEESEQKEPQTEGSEQEEPETEVNKPVDSETQKEEALTEAVLNAELQRVADEASILEEQLEGAMSQAELNEFSAKIYQLWDNELNALWAQLEDTLEKEDLEELRKDQKAWIQQKETKMNEAGAEYEGGSIKPMVVWGCGAEITKDRVYVLADMLKKSLN